MVKVILLFLVTALAEITGCYFVYLWIKHITSAWILVLAAISLMIFTWLLTLHPEASGRIYATYGGIYIITSLVWLRLVDHVKLTAFDLIGASRILVGSLIIITGWRSV